MFCGNSIILINGKCPEESSEDLVMTYDNFIYFTPSGAGETTVLDITGSGEIFIALAQVYSDTRTIKVTIDGGSENTFDTNVNSYNPFSFFFKFNSSIKIVVATTTTGTPAFNAWYGLRS